MQRMTRQRSAIADALAETEDFRSAQQLHELLRDRGEGIGLATVYRTLQALVEAGEVDVLRTEEGEALYRRCGQRHHHHHLLCRHCGTAVDIDVPGLEEWADRTAAAHGFSEMDHVIELVGTCSTCAGTRS